ncbi:hypothetical protein HHK36_033475 [Tetracentron sinense]|uniref:HSF-type DNA-binding domain-containing protein n=1 Tax=Tetracentron sinense TaxID=13715 RepID=A0A834Y5Q6_TETSI|nr:hypothetical protein HHK36_033475 [Tetracentron sinense]
MAVEEPCFGFNNAGLRPRTIGMAKGRRVYGVVVEGNDEAQWWSKGVHEFPQGKLMIACSTLFPHPTCAMASVVIIVLTGSDSATVLTHLVVLLKRCEEMELSMDSQKIVPAPFLTKTYQLVDDPCTDHIVSWGEDETTFVVWRPPEFASDLLPNYFKHNNFSSLVLLIWYVWFVDNMAISMAVFFMGMCVCVMILVSCIWFLDSNGESCLPGFKKIVADRWEFANEFFRKGEKQLLCEIHRRKTSQQHHQHCQDLPPQFLHPDENGGWIESPLPSPNGEYDFLTALSEDNQRLRRRNFMLLSELTHMKKLYNDIIYFLQNHVKPAPTDQRSMNPGSKIIQMGPPFQSQTLAGLQTLKIRGSGSCSATLSEEPNSTVKLFGVPLGSKKRLYPEKMDHEEL